MWPTLCQYWEKNFSLPPLSWRLICRTAATAVSGYYPVLRLFHQVRQLLNPRVIYDEDYYPRLLLKQNLLMRPYLELNLPYLQKLCDDLGDQSVFICLGRRPCFPPEYFCFVWAYQNYPHMRMRWTDLEVFRQLLKSYEEFLEQYSTTPELWVFLPLCQIEERQLLYIYEAQNPAHHGFRSLENSLSPEHFLKVSKDLAENKSSWPFGNTAELVADLQDLPRALEFLLQKKISG